MDNVQDMLNGVSLHTANLLQLDFLTSQHNAARAELLQLFFSKFLVLFLLFFFLFILVVVFIA